MSCETLNLPVKLGEMRACAKRLLSGISNSSALDVNILLSAVLQVNKDELDIHSERILTSSEQSLIDEFVSRRLNGEPVAYITGSKEFWSLPLLVSKAVLVPRPETELVVKQGLKATRLVENPWIADLGTGSGAISLALASELPQAFIFGSDVSYDALLVAKENRKLHGLNNVFFLGCDWLSAFPQNCFHAICSNPPYIESTDPCLNDPAIRHEPSQALVGGADGLHSIRRIVDSAASHLVNDGWLILEHGWNQGSATRKLMETAGFENVHTTRDLSGTERVTEGQLHL